MTQNRRTNGYWHVVGWVVFSAGCATDGLDEDDIHDICRDEIEDYLSSANRRSSESNANRRGENEPDGGAPFSGQAEGSPFGTAEDNHDELARIRSECAANIRAIRTAEMAYDANYDTFVEESRWIPDENPGPEPRAWPEGSGFDTIGWMPDGHVRGSYRVTSTSTTDFLVTCIMDVDGDGTRASFTATKTLNVTMNTRNDVY